MKPLPPRLPSAAARWAFRIGLFAPFFAITIVIANHLEMIDLQGFLLLFWFVFGVALFALFLVLVAFNSLWSRGKKGGRLASWGLFFSMLVLLPYILMGASYFSLPKQADVSTDLIVPPVFLSELREIDGDARAIVAARLFDGYTDMEGRRFRADMASVIEQLNTIKAVNGLTETQRRGRVGANDEISVEYAWRTPVMKIPHALIIRLTDEGDTTFVDIRSRALIGDHDLGRNAAKVRSIQADMDAALIGVVGQ
ncbi:MAG: DUF1499 domain-containing protein [Ahrensia sp.]